MKRIIKLVLAMIMFVTSICISQVDVRAEGKIEAFVTRLYSLCMNRQPDPVGKADWVNQLKTKRKSASEVVYGFFFSKEMRERNLSDGEYVEVCYKVLMNRVSDYEGKVHWVNKLVSNDRSVVVKGFVDSIEFANVCRLYEVNKGTIQADTANKGLSLTNTTHIPCDTKVREFVERCYTKTLGRASDERGVSHWVGKITSGAYTPARVAAEGFYHSQEFIRKFMGNGDYIRSLYRTFLGREADSAGYNNWLNEMKNGKSRDQILNGFANSREFGEIVNSYAQEPCVVGPIEIPVQHQLILLM